MNKKKKRKQFEDAFWAALFSIDVPAHLNELPVHLNHIRMRLWDRVEDEHLALLITGVKSVNMLDLDETDITNTGISYLAQMENITELRLKGIRTIDDGCITDLNKIKGLELLHVRGTSITIDGLLQMDAKPKLKLLLFSHHDEEPDKDKMNKLRLLMPACEIIVDGVTYQSIESTEEDW